MLTEANALYHYNTPPSLKTAEIQKHACGDLLLVFSLNQKTSVHTVACLVKAKPATSLVTEPSEDTQHVDRTKQTRVRTHLTTHRQTVVIKARGYVAYVFYFLKDTFVH